MRRSENDVRSQIKAWLKVVRHVPIVGRYTILQSWGLLMLIDSAETVLWTRLAPIYVRQFKNIHRCR
jgi:hypothetical protein